MNRLTTHRLSLWLREGFDYTDHGSIKQNQCTDLKPACHGKTLCGSNREILKAQAGTMASAYPTPPWMKAVIEKMRLIT